MRTKVKYLVLMGNAIKNLVANSGFVNALIWGKSSCSLAVVNRIASVTATGGSATAILMGTPSTPGASGSKWYARCKFRVTNASCVLLRLYTHNGITAKTAYSVSSPTQDEWHEASGIVTQTDAGNVHIRMSQQYADAATAASKVMEIDGTYGVMLIDISKLPASLRNKSDADLKAILDTWTYFEGYKTS